MIFLFNIGKLIESLINNSSFTRSTICTFDDKSDLEYFNNEGIMCSVSNDYDTDKNN